MDIPKYKLGDKVWILVEVTRPIDVCKYCGRGTPKPTYKAFQETIIGVVLDEEFEEFYYHLTNNRGTMTEDVLYDTKEEAEEKT